MKRIQVAPMIIISLLILFTSTSLDYHRFVDSDFISGALTLEPQDKKDDMLLGERKIVPSAISFVLTLLEVSPLLQPPRLSPSIAFRDEKEYILRC